MFSRFFVRRPVFAWVIAILIMLAGVLAIRTLPVGQYPDVAPPAVKISATYTGASAETLENSVTQVIEQQLTGLIVAAAERRKALRYRCAQRLPLHPVAPTPTAVGHECAPEIRAWATVPDADL